MRINNPQVIPFIIAGLACLNSTSSSIVSAQQGQQPFTIAADIGLNYFGGPQGTTDLTGMVRFSPDGNYVAAYTSHGNLKRNRVEDSLQFYRSRDMVNFLKHSDVSLSPAWIVRVSDKEGPAINSWRWLSDSSGVAFLESTPGSNTRLVVATLQSQSVETLTSPQEIVEAFDIRDREHYVYRAASVTDGMQKQRADSETSAVIGTGRDLSELLFENNPLEAHFFFRRKSHNWAVVGARRFQLNDYGDMGNLVLSPDGHSLLTTHKILAPASWAKLYPAPYLGDPDEIYPGKSVDRYVIIDLETGTTKVALNAPTGDSAGWFADEFGSSVWSRDGRTVILPGTFLPSTTPSRPCVAVMDVRSHNATCVEILKGHTKLGGEEPGYHFIGSSRFFTGSNSQRLLVGYRLPKDFFASGGTTEYRRASNGAWQVARRYSGALPDNFGPGDLQVTVTQSINIPQRLVAMNGKTSRVIEDPNPQLKHIQMGQTSIITWKDKMGRDWIGGLYLPTDYKPGQRYPLVIQTHGFSGSEFVPSGVFPTAFAARALAAEGMVVLQTGSACPGKTPEEGPCAAAGFGAAAQKLVSQGLVDPNNIGIVGFSRTCFYVMEALTTGAIHLKAASITDGVMEDYFQYISFSDIDQISREADSMIGAPPFGAGLQLWLKRSPGFNLDKITAPLLIVAEGPVSLLTMWQPYAGLHYLHKPVELVMLNTDEHILTNPAMRMASQGGTVDWFRFWLQGYKDPDPAKAAQYKRWEALRKLQQANETKTAATAMQ